MWTSQCAEQSGVLRVCMTRSVDELVVGLAVGIWQLPDLRSEHGAFEVVLGPILWAALAAVAIFL